MKTFKVTATRSGMFATIKVNAQTKWEAIERAMYQHGLFNQFPNREMYKVSK